MLEKKRGKERIVYLDGRFVPESQAKISIFDTAFHNAYMVHEAIRTFNGKLFKLEEHTARLFRSLRCARIDAAMGPSEMKKISLEVLEANQHLLGENDDYWIYQHVSAGVVPQFRYEDRTYKDSTVIIYCWTLPFEAYARYYEVGAHAITPWVRRISPQCVDPKIKTCSRMDLNLGTREAKLIDPDGYCLLLDEQTNVAEGDGYNFFIVSKGVLRTPSLRNVLGGISRETVMELAKEMKICVEETDIQTYDVYNADEAFFTATSYCILPVTKFNGIQIGQGKPGLLTKRLLEAWSNKVGINIVKQALSHLEEK